jgi:hypothetical protein
VKLITQVIAAGMLFAFGFWILLVRLPALYAPDGAGIVLILSAALLLVGCFPGHGDGGKHA